MKLILKKDLEHQSLAIQKLSSVFHNVRMISPMKSIENPVFDINDPFLYQNIRYLQNDLPLSLQGVNREEAYLNIDVKMETGTGKTYVYTRVIYELNKLYGFNKFVIVVPSLPIKAGAESFIKNSNNVRHFKNVCGYDGDINLRSVEGVKRNKKNKKNFIPNGIRQFVISPYLQKNTIEVLLVNMHHLKETDKGVLVRDDYDSHIGGFFRPVEAIAATRPIVLIDEPHRFNRDNSTFRFIEEHIKPQLIVRFGATFPTRDIGRGKSKIVVKDYRNLIYDLNIHKAFEQNLIKGVAKEHVESSNNKDEVFKILSMEKGNYVRFQKTILNENNKLVKSVKDLKRNDSLSLLSPSFQGITIDGILSTKILLSNGEEKFTGDTFFADVFATSYVRESIQLTLKRHFETERENFNRKFKIKTLALFFIDDIHSYRDNGEKTPYLRDIFEDELRRKLQEEIKNCSSAESEYCAYLEESLRDIKVTHAGYFAQDNVSNDAEIEKEVNTILFDKEKLLSLEDGNGKLNTTRFVFSKWTLREGWDNPNIFTITKLRSSGSEESKLQEIGRGLRLPVDETGNRIENESFTLNYIVDFTEKDFISKLEREIYGDVSSELQQLSTEQIEALANNKNISKEEVVTQLLQRGYISFDLKVKNERIQEFMKEYPDVFNKLNKNKVRDRNVDKGIKVRIRRENYLKLKELWEELNRKYYLYFDTIPKEVLINTIVRVVTEDVSTSSARKTERDTIEMVDGELIFNKSYDSVDTRTELTLDYGDFLKRIATSTNLAIPLIHEGLRKASESTHIEKSFFTADVVRLFSIYFRQRIYDELLKVYSYKRLPNTSIHPTQLTQFDGTPRDFVKTSAYLGVKKSDGIPLETYLYDTVLWDSPIEEGNIRSNVDSVEVFAKIPKRTIQIPFIDGTTYSPDFMYVIKDDKGQRKLNVVLESKDVAHKQQIRKIEQDKIDAAEKLFDMVKSEGISVTYRAQTKNEDILSVINDIIS